MASRFILTTVGIISLSSNFTYASMPENLYKEALQAANQKVLRQKQNLAQNNALSSSMIKSMFGRFYQVGDSWDVAVWPIYQTQLAMMRSPESSSQTPEQIGSGGIIHYEVTEIKNGINPSITLKITQQASHGLTIVDSKVDYVQLEFTDQLAVGKKSYHLKNETQEVRASTNGLRVSRGRYEPLISNLDLLPIDVPDITTAENSAATQFPNLPRKIKETLGQVGLVGPLGMKTDLNQSSVFKQEDFFGRPVEVLWQKGNPWPSYMKTSTGIALLIRKGTV